MTLAQPFLAIGIQSDLSIVLQREARLQVHLYYVPHALSAQVPVPAQSPCTQAGNSPAEVGYAEYGTEEGTSLLLRD